MVDPSKIRYASYGSVRRRALKHGQVALYRPLFRPASLLIAQGTRGQYSHAALVARLKIGKSKYRRICLLDTVQFRGGRRVLLSDQVRMYPGRWDIYDVLDADYNPNRSVLAMLSVVGHRYGWRAIAKAAFLYLPFIRWFVRPLADDEANGDLPFCSMAVSRALREGGVDPVPNCADRITTPNDLARSAALKYRFTLIE